MWEVSPIKKKRVYKEEGYTLLLVNPSSALLKREQARIKTPNVGEVCLSLERDILKCNNNKKENAAKMLAEYNTRSIIVRNDYNKIKKKEGRLC